MPVSCRLACPAALLASACILEANQPPTAEFVSPPSQGATVDLSYDVQLHIVDPDGDPVTGSLDWEGLDRRGTFATGLAAGDVSITIDTSVLASGSYTLLARLDDGNGQIEVPAVGKLTVPAGRNARPTITIVSPEQGDSFSAARPVEVTFSVDDLDASALACDVVATQASRTTQIASGVSMTPAEQRTIEWAVEGLPVAADYRIRVTVSDDGDPPLSSTAESAAFAVIEPPPQVSFASQVLPLLARCDGGSCHDSTQSAEGLDLTPGAAHRALVAVPSRQCPAAMLVKPGNPARSYLISKLVGTGECMVGSRMPKPPETPLSEIEIQTIRDWISNGAPDN